MSKKAVSVTLDDQNLLWLKARARARGARSLSAELDALLTAARNAPAERRSVFGRVRIIGGVEGLAEGGREIREMFNASLQPTPRAKRRG